MTRRILVFIFLSNSFISFGQLSSKQVDFLVPTFLGGKQRNFYGNKAPDCLGIEWKLNLGEGETIISRRLGKRVWKGAGWTGQPLLIKEDSILFLIQGAYDHHLRKINARNGEVEWKYKFDDVIKGTGTIYRNPYARDSSEQYMIFQGSRLGYGNYLDSKHIPSYRAISYLTGEELWRLDVKWDASYSRDVDASCLVIKDTIYIGLENGLLTSIDPQPYHCNVLDSMCQPQIFQEEPLYTEQDILDHNKNVVTESSPALLNNHLYIASGSGHVYGYNLETKKIDWDFYIGSDMDGSIVITEDSMLLASVEKQYIKGQGGIFKLNPRKEPDSAVVWYMATENRDFAGWEGGVIGSCAVNDLYKSTISPLAAFTALDGYTYVVKHKELSKTKNTGPDGKTVYPSPEIIFKYETGASIATPIFSSNRLIVPTYDGLHLFAYDPHYNFTLLDKFVAEFEATPIIWGNKIYLASRNGYLYCFGSKTE